MRAFIWILLAALPVLGQPEGRQRPDRRVKDYPKATAEPGEESAKRRVIEEASARGAGAIRRFAVVLDQPPVAVQIAARESISGTAGRAARGRVDASRSALRAEMSRRGLAERGSASVLINAIFVEGRAEDMEALAAAPGVRYVQEVRKYRRAMTKANDVMRVPGAWNVVGGQGNAGAGSKIAIIDSGVDHSHPALQDSSLPMPAGFPKCTGDECRYTNTKVIAARSFVEMLVYAFPDDTRPDDLSPRDRVGHGTAAAAAAAGRNAESPLGQMSGVAPAAYIGNYKVFGSPGVNDFTTDEVVIAALEAAFLDGMNIASLSLGGPSLWGPNDRGSICGEAAGTACDIQVEAVENAVRRGLTVVVSAGNDGDIGTEIPTLNTIGSPGTAPSAITVGASVNSHILYQSVRVDGGPGNLQRVNAYFGNGPRPAAPLRAPARDVAGLDGNGTGCSTLAGGALAGTIALVVRGECAFATKVNNAQQAGAVAVIVYQPESNGIFSPGGLQNTAIPMVFIGRDSGQSLKSYIASNANNTVTLDPGFTEVSAPADEIAVFSSQGPATGTNAIKPEVVGVGLDVYLPTQRYDPNGEMYDSAGYTRSNGTSFSAPMVAGAAAIIRQRNPALTPAQIKSALVNSANPEITDYDYDGNPIRAYQSGAGAGQLDVEKAVRTEVAAEPATISFGKVTTLPVTQQLRLVNTSTATLNLRASISERVRANGASVTLSATSFAVPPGQVATLTVRLEGSVPTANWYEGDIVVEGSATTLRIPYAFLVGNNTAFSGMPLTAIGFKALVNGRLPRLNAKWVDSQGVPVEQLPVRFRAEVGGGAIDTAAARTDALGIADAVAVAGPRLGEQVFSAEAGGKLVEFVGTAIQRAAIQTGGVVNAASGQIGAGIAPGSYISIFGSALADATLAYNTPYLPLALASVSIGFDVPGRQLSYPGRIHFVSPGQINVQVPWELAGQPSADLKVSVGDFSSATVRMPVTDYSPAAFEYSDPGSGQLLTAALDQNSALVTAANPARRGQVVQIYANGIGPVDNAPPSGEAAGAQPLSTCRVQPEVTIGGIGSAIQFCGLAPGFVGLYQVNAIVPSNAPTGTQPLVIRAGGVTSKTANLPVQ